MREVWKI